MPSDTRNGRTGRIWSYVCWAIVGALAVAVCVAHYLATRVPSSTPEVELRPEARSTAALAESLRQLHSRMGPLQRGDWLEGHTELGQTFAQFLQDHPEPQVSGQQTKLYLVCLGPKTPRSDQLFHETARFLSACYGVPCEFLPSVPLDDVPATARRPRDRSREQYQTGYLLKTVLAPRLPKDGVALLGLTTYDLYPDESWNYVFGQASISERVGVWSLARLGNADAGTEEYRRCLRRMVQIAIHETGHMFGLLHCIEFECCMNGSNNLPESDRRP